jgi:cell division transport system ATP-binding protein
MQVAIQVSELKFATEDGVLILDGISFGVPREGFVFVVGPPSSGKTVLVKLILKELRPAGGQILLSGRNVLRLTERKMLLLRRRVGYVPEDLPVLPDRTVRENLLFKLRALGYSGDELEEEMSQALELSRLVGLEGELAGDLPGLQLVRLALALALCPKPTVLIADDPFRDLGKTTSDSLMGVLSSIQNAGISLLVTTRDEELPIRHGFPDRPPRGEERRGVVRLRQGVVP